MKARDRDVLQRLRAIQHEVDKADREHRQRVMFELLGRQIVEWGLCPSYEIDRRTALPVPRASALLVGYCRNGCGRVMPPPGAGIMMACPLRTSSISERARIRKVIAG